jgi:hypothetical protein
MRSTPTRRPGSRAGWVAAVLIGLTATTASTTPAAATAATPAANQASAGTFARAVAETSAPTRDGAPGAADAGLVAATRQDTPVALGPLAQCRLTGPDSGSTPGGTAEGVASFGQGSTACTTDAAAGSSKVQVDGNEFTLTALAPYGGPRIRLDQYSATCSATRDGTSAGYRFSGLHNLPGTLPQQVPNNYVVQVRDGDQLQATVTFNEVPTALPADGSIALTVMHVKLFPDGGPVRGDIYVGSVTCAPVR